MTTHDLVEKWLLLQAIIARPDISSNAKVIAAKILDHLNSQDGRCFPSYQTLGKGTGMKRRPPMNAVKELETAGILIVHRRRGPGGRNRTNLFDFDWTLVPPDRRRKKSGMKQKMPGDTKLAISSTRENAVVSRADSKYPHERNIELNDDEQQLVREITLRVSLLVNKKLSMIYYEADRDLHDLNLLIPMIEKRRAKQQISKDIEDAAEVIAKMKRG